MERFRVVGGTSLTGEVSVVGAKNSALKLMAGSLLAVGKTRLSNVPAIIDVTIMAELLRRLGCLVDYDADRGVVTAAPAAVGPPAGVRLPHAAPGTTVAWSGIGRGLSAYVGLAVQLALAVEGADAQALPDARAIARLGALRLARGESVDAGALAPLYLRDSVALTEVQRGVR